MSEAEPVFVIAIRWADEPWHFATVAPRPPRRLEDVELTLCGARPPDGIFVRAWTLRQGRGGDRVSGPGPRGDNTCGRCLALVPRPASLVMPAQPLPARSPQLELLPGHRRRWPE